MKFSFALPTVLVGAAIVVLQPEVAFALTATEINAIAKQITVRIDGANTGSGMIVKKEGRTYTVVTNWHVVQVPGNYTVQTADGRSYSFKSSQVKRFRGVDLAEFQFTTNETYSVAELGDSNKVTEGTIVYAAGWADRDSVCLERCYQFRVGNISARLSNAKNGYILIHTNISKPGMSGGPVLDSQGRLVGINGLSKYDNRTQATDFFAIPINTYLTLVKEASLVAIAPKPEPQPKAEAQEPLETIEQLENLTESTLPIANPPNIQNSSNQSIASLIKSLPGPPPSKTYSSFKDFIALLPNGNPIAVSNEKIFIWQGLDNQKKVYDDEFHDSADISPNGKLIVTGTNHYIKIWNIDTGKIIRQFNSTFLYGNEVAFNPNGKLIAGCGYSLDKKGYIIKLWNIDSGNYIPTIQTVTGCNLAFSIDGSILASGGGHNIQLWNVNNAKLIRTIKGYPSQIMSLAFNPVSKMLVSGHLSGDIVVWNRETGQRISVLKAPSDTRSLYSLKFHPKRNILASGHDGIVNLWNMDSFERVGSINRNGRGDIRNISFSLNGDLLAIMPAEKKNIEIWKLKL